jgi:hypothetical protein
MAFSSVSDGFFIAAAISCQQKTYASRVHNFMILLYPTQLQFLLRALSCHDFENEQDRGQASVPGFAVQIYQNWVKAAA